MAKETPALAGVSLPRLRDAISLEESMVLRALPDEGGTDIDAVARAAGLPIAKTNTLLVQLRLKRQVRFLPGNRVARHPAV